MKEEYNMTKEVIWGVLVLSHARHYAAFTQPTTAWSEATDEGVPRGSLSVCVSVAVALYTVEKVTYSTIRERWG